MPRRGFGRVGWPVLLVLIPAVGLVVVLGLQLRDSLQDPAQLEPCAVPDTGQAVFLVDLQKPLAGAHASLPGRLLRDVTLDLPARTELTVYVLADYAEAPRMLLGRLCKAYGNEELAVRTAKDQDAATRDCDNLPAQIPSSVRDSARRFCRERDTVVGRIDALAAQARSTAVTNAYLVEAFEDTGRDFERGVGPGSLYVFSDMMQHADWFSHLDTTWNEWSYERFAELRSARGPLAGDWTRMGSEVAATVFYLARKDVTEHPRRRAAHLQFWEAYFGAARLSFADQPPVLDYTAPRLMEVPTEAELAGRERERTRYERAAVERARAELERSREALAADRERFARERREWERRESELRREQERLREQEAELAAERERMAGRAAESPEVVRSGGPG